MPNVGAWSAAHAKTVTLKMQAAWPSGNDPFFIMAGDYVTRVNSMSGGSLKIELLPVGAILKTAEIADGVSTGVVDASHSVSAYWYGKTLLLLYSELVLHMVFHLRN